MIEILLGGILGALIAIGSNIKSIKEELQKLNRHEQN